MKYFCFFLVLLSFQTLSADRLTVSQSWQWRKLLQFNENNISEVPQKEFFTSANGSRDAYGELEQFLSVLSSEPRKTACKFPARYWFLKQHFQLPSIDLKSCDELRDWLKTDQPSSVSLVFADGYLKNPASFHGHLFIKIDRSDKPSKNLFDNSLNFGALVPSGENPITYMAKGLFGGYRAKYSSQPFYRHNISYAQEELRNLWHYKLALSSSQAMLFSLHLFELRATDYHYLFMSKNCAYYVARALELIVGEYMVFDSDITVIPSEVVANLVSLKSGSLIENVYLERSQQSQFQIKYSQLSSVEKNIINNIILTGDMTLLDQVVSKAQHKVMVVLASYYAFRVKQDEKDKALQSKQKTVLKWLLQQPIAQHEWINKEPERKPHDGQPAALIRGGVLSTPRGNWSTITLRPTYYDRLQPAGGRPEHSAMSMGEVAFSFNDERLELDKIWLVNIENLNLSNTGVEGDGGLSWSLKFGGQRLRERSTDAHFSGFVSGGIGKAKTVAQDLVIYAMLEGRLHTKERAGDKHNLTAQPKLGFELNWRKGKGICELSLPVAITSNIDALEKKIHCEASFFSSSNTDVRVSYSSQDERLLRAQFSLYF